MKKNEVHIESLNLKLKKGGPYIVLKEIEGGRSLHIHVSMMDASAIFAALHDIELPRPLTQDLMFNALDTLSVSISRVCIVDLKDDIFYARIVLDPPYGDEITLDSRPSDAINLALRSNAPIFVYERVFEKLELPINLDGFSQGLKRVIELLEEEEKQ